jgi:hypothetical protein
MWRPTVARLKQWLGTICARLSNRFAEWEWRLTRPNSESTSPVEVKFDFMGQTIQMPCEEYTSMVASLMSMETKTPAHGPRSFLLH